MPYYLNLFSPETYKSFSESQENISGFRISQRGTAQKLAPGDKMICYMTKMSRWIGVLEVASDVFIDSTPLFFPEDDPYVVRFKVKRIAWLPLDKSIPIHDPIVWDRLSFTKGSSASSSGWTGILRRSLNQLTTEDGQALEDLIRDQTTSNRFYDVDQSKYQRLSTQRIRRADKTVAVTVPTDDADTEATAFTEASALSEATRESACVQALLARIGEQMGYTIWIPKNDRSAVLREWTPANNAPLDHLPLNYDDATLQTIENIDVLWLKKRSIVRAFEVEHTTAVYSGILRMADLLALQPNMDIRLHIVAPERRKEKVFTEIQRPVFSLLDRAPLSECCTFISYDSLRELGSQTHLTHLSDSVLEEYEESAE